LLCLPTRVCAQPGLAVRAVSAIGAHLELAGRLGVIGLGILRSPDALHSLGLRTEGYSLSRPCASQQGWRRSVVWVSSEQPKRAAVAQLRQASLPVLRHVQWKHCRAARLPSSQPRARPPSRTSSSRAPCRRQVLGAIGGRVAPMFQEFSKNDSNDSNVPRIVSKNDSNAAVSNDSNDSNAAEDHSEAARPARWPRGVGHRWRRPRAGASAPRGIAVVDARQARSRQHGA